jgi:hypothetical protein
MLSIKLLRLKSPCVVATLEDTVEAAVVMVAIAVVHLQEEVEGGFGCSYGGRGEQRLPLNKKCQLYDKEGHTIHRC